MRFLVDECTGPEVARWLREQRHEVFSVFEQARGMDDEGVICQSLGENWILITNDKDLGEKVYRDGRLHRGVILLRLKDERPESKIRVLRQLLENYGDRLSDAFMVLTEDRVRFGGSSQFDSPADQRGPGNQDATYSQYRPLEAEDEPSEQ
jgi:predicted nuclease of predicted toxin-antitoxin system